MEDEKRRKKRTGKSSLVELAGSPRMIDGGAEGASDGVTGAITEEKKDKKRRTKRKVDGHIEEDIRKREELSKDSGGPPAIAIRSMLGKWITVRICQGKIERPT